MGNIMTRAALSKIMADEGLTAEQRTEQVMSLYGRALDDGYISKTAAQTAQETALANARTEWEKSIPKPDPKESDEYKKLASDFDAYRTMQTARGSEDYKGVKGKFFETVYNMVDRKEGAKPIAEQMKDIRTNWAEYFEEESGQAKNPQFGSPDLGTMPKGKEGTEATFLKAWGIPTKN